MSSSKNDRKFRSQFGKTIRDDSPVTPASNVRFAEVIADALRRDYGGTHASVKTVVGLTQANERAVKNWFGGKNGPSGENLVELLRHSDEVLEALLLMAGRIELVTAKKLVDARHKLQEMLTLIDELQGD